MSILKQYNLVAIQWLVLLNKNTILFKVTVVIGDTIIQKYDMHEEADSKIIAVNLNKYLNPKGKYMGSISI